MKLENEAQQETDIFQKAMGLAKENQRLTREREQAEEQLQQATRQKELILRSAGEGIFGLDLEGNTTFCNPAAAKMLGYHTEDLLGKPQHALIHHSKPDGSPYPREDCHIYAAFKDGKVHRESEEVFWRKDGTSFPVDYVSTPIRENEKLAGAVVTFKDITERKKAEQALRESEARANAVLNNAIEGIITIDERGTIKTFNPAAEELFGYKPSEIAGTNIKFLMPEPFQSEHDQYLKKYLETGITKIIGIGQEVIGLRKDGSTFPMDLGVSEVYLGESRMFTGIVRDITERKYLEKKLWRNEQRFRAISESSPIGIFQIDGDDSYIFVNTRWQIHVKRELKDSLGNKWWEIIHPDDRDYTFEHWVKCEEKKEPLKLDCRILRPDGEVIWSQIKANFFSDDYGKSTIGTIEEIPDPR
jgi:PAS domain S-box-containing protein